MKMTALATIALSGIATFMIAAAQPAAAAPAGPDSVQDTVNRLESNGYKVILNKVGTAPLEKCTVSGCARAARSPSFARIGGTKLLSAFYTRRSTSTRPADHGGAGWSHHRGHALPLLGSGGTVVTDSAATVHPRRTELAAEVFNSDAEDRSPSTDGDTAPRARSSWAALVVVLHGAPLPGVGAKCTHHRALDDRANHRMPRNSYQPRRLGLHICAHPYLLSTPRNTPEGIR